MLPAPKPPGLLERFRRGPAPSFDDAADLGTCIGLEFSLDQTPQATAQAPRKGWQAPGWMQRLTSRVRSSP